MILQVDNGAQLSLIKESKVDPKTLNKKDTYTLEGFLPGATCQTIGQTFVTYLFGDKHKIMIPFHVVPDTYLPNVDGLIGSPALLELKAVINFHLNRIELPELKEYKYFFKPEILKAQTVRILALQFQEKFNGTHIVTASTAKNTQDAIVEIREGRTAFPFSNKKYKAETTENIKWIVTPLEKKLVLHVQTQPGRKEKFLQTLRVNHLTPREQKALIDLLWTFNDRIALKGEKIVHEVAKFECTLPTKTCHPQHAKMYRIPDKHRPIVSNYVNECLDQGILKHSLSPWNAPCLVVPKKMDASGEIKWRVVIDYRKLNETLISDEHPLPRIEDIFDRLGRARLFSTLDLASGFHQIPIAPSDQEKTAFSTHEGHFEYTRMPFGLKNAPRVFQRAMNACLAGYIGTQAFIYLDDIIIFSEDFDQHMVRLRNILSRLRQFGFLIQPDKCEFLKSDIVYLGHQVSADGLRPVSEKLDKLRRFPIPTNLKELQGFLGLVNYYHKFIPNYSDKIQPLLHLTRKGVEFLWNDERNKTFEAMKKVIENEAVLQYPNFDKTFFLHTDASNVAVGAVLSQYDSENNLRPILFESSTLNHAQRNYSTIERELYAIVWAVKKFRPYLIGQRFEILSDHKPLECITKSNTLSGRLLRWRLELSEYDFTIKHVKGKDNVVADAFSRIILKVTTKRKAPMDEPFPWVPLQAAKRILVLTSPDKLKNLDWFTGTFSIDTIGQVERVNLHHKIVYIAFYRETKNKPFDPILFEQTLETVKHLLEKYKETELSIFDHFNSISTFQLGQVENTIRKILEIPKLSCHFRHGA
ncbi:hypothetical protein V9T40_007178 [Parthenolecanium corni]|uniref:RNA-directed DNA polymerase n=1 Tax=Parthenolecanium corni TaxID=536013 RepID=A0AAN9TY99_9HEMI